MHKFPILKDKCGFFGFHKLISEGIKYDRFLKLISKIKKTFLLSENLIQGLWLKIVIAKILLKKT